jgi:hypothetical protein
VLRFLQFFVLQLQQQFLVVEQLFVEFVLVGFFEQQFVEREQLVQQFERVVFQQRAIYKRTVFEPRVVQ